MARITLIMTLSLFGFIHPGWGQFVQQPHTENITFNNTNHRLLQIEGGRVAWIEDHIVTGDPLLKWFTGFEIVRVDSGMARTDYKLDGRYIAYVTPGDSLALYDLDLWQSIPLFDLSALPSGRHFDLEEDNLVYVEGTSPTQSQVNLYSIIQTTTTPLSDQAYLYLDPVFDQGLMACVGMDFTVDTSSAVFWHDGNTFQALSNFADGKIDKLNLKDGMIIWRYTHLDTSRLYLSDGDSLRVPWERTGGNIRLTDVATGNGWFGYAWWDTLAGSGEVTFSDAFTPQETTIVVSTYPAAVLIDRNEGVYQTDTTFSSPQTFRYDFETGVHQTLSFSSHEPAYDDGQLIWTFGDAVEFRTTTSHQQLTSGFNAGRVQTKYKCLDSNQVAWQEFTGSDTDIFYFDGDSIIQVTNSLGPFRDFLMTENGRLIFREEFNTVWSYDPLGGLQVVLDTLDSLQSERHYLSGDEMVFDALSLSDTNQIEQIWHYDFNTSTLSPVTQDLSPELDNFEPLIDNGNIIWYRDSSSTLTLMHFDGLTTVPLAPDPFGYHIQDSIIVWSESDGTFNHLHIKNTQSGNTSQITFENFNDREPLTDGRNIFFMRQYPDTTYLMAHDLETNLLKRIARSSAFYDFHMPQMTRGMTLIFKDDYLSCYDGHTINFLDYAFGNSFRRVADLDLGYYSWFRGATDQGNVYRGILEPKVEFLAEKTRGIAPLNVRFFNRSWQGAESYLWDFGDGNQSTEVDPYHTYVLAGVYTVTLMAYGPENQEITETKTNLIHVAPAPPGIYEERDSILRQAALRLPSPNPFHPKTVIEFVLPVEGRVELAVFDLLGRKIKTLVEKVQKAGVYRKVWEGRDERGLEVTSGIYFVRMTFNTQTFRRKAILLR